MQNDFTTMQRLRGMLRLFRPELPAAAGLCVIIGEILALERFPSFPMLSLGFACGFFLSGSALITNDYFDIEVDKINAPQRPLPSGLVTPAAAMALGLISAGIGFAAAAAIHPVALVISVIIWAAGFLYNWKLKAAGLLGNLIVCSSVASTFLIGGIAAGQVWNRMIWVFALITFCFDLGEEIASDALDAEGDKQRGSRSIAIVYGKRTALRLAAGLFGIVVLLTFLLIAWGGSEARYVIVLPLMDVLIVYFLMRLLRSQHEAESRAAARSIYISGSLGLLAFVIGSVVR